MIINGASLIRAAPILGMVPLKINGELTSYGLGEAGYDIRIKQQIEFSRQKRYISPMRVGSADDNNQIVRLFEQGRFILASSVEEFNMPINLVGEVKDKSTWARQGLSVFNTVIEPGWKGFLTLELVYHGTDDLIIPAGSGIAQVLFYPTSDTAQYSGKYNNQANHPVPAIASAELKRPYNGLNCPLCGKPQFFTRSGVSCADGHGGMQGVEI